MTIALLTDGFYPFTLGGIQKHSYYLAKYWARQGVNVHIFHPNQADDVSLQAHFTADELQRLQFHFVKHPSSPSFPGHYVYNSYCYSKALYKAVSDKSYDGIYAQGFTGWYILKQHPQHPRVVTNLHGLEMYQKAINRKNKLEHHLLRIAAKPIIKHSNKQISLGGKLTPLLYQQGAKAGSVFEVPNAISPEWLQEIKPDRFAFQNINKPVRFQNTIRRFIFIGRYERRKGIEEINTVAQQLTAEGSAFELHFIGPIPENKRLDLGDNEKDIGHRAKGIGHRTKGIGDRAKRNTTTLNPKPHNLNPKPYKTNPSDLSAYRPNYLHYHGTITSQQTIQTLLHESDVLLCPSYSEGMPTVILEAMACGCALIATDVGASGELVDKNNGWLISGDIVSGLKNAMMEAMSVDDSELQQMKENAYNRVKEKYTWDVVARRTLELLGW
ncbi:MULTISPECIES: glycosyltransferase family 4 protein [unclassified Carboxylicivirga]|uniref:glycosyltransferase family 4 protein n=1 Tax=Carboxylicivirga TaxID=1628153 RepID=UPI003D34D5E6